MTKKKPENLLIKTCGREYLLTPDMIGDMMTTKQTSVYLSRSMQWVTQTRFYKNGPPSVKIRHSIFYPKVLVDRWVLDEARLSQIEDQKKYA